MDMIQDLEITFEKEEQVSIHKLKIYTPENRILELEGEEILKQFNLENIEIVGSTKDAITIKVNPNSSIRMLD